MLEAEFVDGRKRKKSSKVMSVHSMNVWLNMRLQQHLLEKMLMVRATSFAQRKYPMEVRKRFRTWMLGGT